MAANSTTPSPDEHEHELISTSLEVERLDANLFRSKAPLCMPVRRRGVFGGLVISQAIVSATDCVDASYGLHSLHSYFLLSASSALPIYYYVDRLRKGRSYSTFAVRARQNGETVFIMLCSFHRPEPEQPFHQQRMPTDLPNPDEMELDIEFYRRWKDSDQTEERMRNVLERLIQERSRSPVHQTVQVHREAPNGGMVVMFYMKAKGVNVPKYAPAFQKAILGYMSDLGFIGVAIRTLGLKAFSKGPNALAMNVSLDHTMFYYSDAIDCSDWILHVIQSPRTGSGRGVVVGQMYARDGNLIAITTQEGVVRAGIASPGPDRPPREQLESKL